MATAILRQNLLHPLCTASVSIIVLQQNNSQENSNFRQLFEPTGCTWHVSANCTYSTPFQTATKKTVRKTAQSSTRAFDHHDPGKLLLAHYALAADDPRVRSVVFPFKVRVGPVVFRDANFYLVGVLAHLVDPARLQNIDKVVERNVLQFVAATELHKCSLAFWRLGEQRRPRYQRSIWAAARRNGAPSSMLEVAPHVDEDVVRRLRTDQTRLRNESLPEVERRATRTTFHSSNSTGSRNSVQHSGPYTRTPSFVASLEQDY